MCMATHGGRMCIAEGLWCPAEGPLMPCWGHPGPWPASWDCQGGRPGAGGWGPTATGEKAPGGGERGPTLMEMSLPIGSHRRQGKTTNPVRKSSAGAGRFVSYVRKVAPTVSAYDTCRPTLGHSGPGFPLNVFISQCREHVHMQGALDRLIRKGDTALP